MKRFLIVVFALFLCLTISAPGMAQSKPAAPEKVAPAPEKAEKPEVAKPEAPKEAEKPKPKKYAGIVGTVEKIEGQFLTFKTQKDTLTFDISGAKFKGYKSAADIKVGDKISATYIKGVMTVTKIASAKKAAKK